MPADLAIDTGVPHAAGVIEHLAGLVSMRTMQAVLSRSRAWRVFMTHSPT